MSAANKMVGIVLSALLLTGLAGCEKTPGEKPGESAGKAADRAIDNAGNKMSQAADATKEQAAKAGAAIDDTALTAKVKSALVAEPNLSALQINVETAKGVVTLSGTADSAANSDRAKEVAANVKGVASVDNRLTVKAPQ